MVQVELMEKSLSELKSIFVNITFKPQVNGIFLKLVALWSKDQSGKFHVTEMLEDPHSILFSLI